MNVVLVEWEDASTDDEGPWVRVEGAQPIPAKVFLQVGFLLEDTPEAIVLTAAVEPAGKGLMASRERIPRGMVRSITVLSPTKRKR
jgi:hypothetical protein